MFQWPLTAAVTGSLTVFIGGLNASTPYWVYIRAASGLAANLVGPVAPGVDRPLVRTAPALVSCAG
jgi:hypothetical protein